MYIVHPKHWSKCHTHTATSIALQFPVVPIMYYEHQRKKWLNQVKTICRQFVRWKKIGGILQLQPMDIRKQEAFFWRKEFFFGRRKWLFWKRSPIPFVPRRRQGFAASICQLMTNPRLFRLPELYFPFLCVFPLCHLVHIFDKCLLFDFLFLWCLFQVFL